MIERLPSQYSVIVDGEVLPWPDFYDGIENAPDPHPRHLYDGVNMADEKAVDDRGEQIIGALIDGEGLAKMDAVEFAAERKRELAQVALFELPSEAAVISSLEQHPSNQNTASEERHVLANSILAEYRQEAEKKYAKLDILRRAVFVAVVRNISRLSAEDLELIAETIGYDKDFFRQSERGSAAKSEQRDPDWFERHHPDY